MKEMPIDVDKLKYVLKQKYKSVDAAIRELDYGDFTKSAFAKGVLSKQYVDALERHGMKYEDYSPSVPEIPIAEEKPQYEIPEETWKMLEDVIVLAIKRAMNE